VAAMLSLAGCVTVTVNPPARPRSSKSSRKPAGRNRRMWSSTFYESSR
jgi:hypothetical protein